MTTGFIGLVYQTKCSKNFKVFLTKLELQPKDALAKRETAQETGPIDNLIKLY